MRTGAVDMIPLITPDDLDERVLAECVYPDMSVTHHWSTLWEPEFYAGLARAGFISVATEHVTHGPLLIPEMQPAYAVLDWPAVHESRHVRRLRRSGRLEDDGIELRVRGDCHAVIDRIREQYAERCWLIDPYVEVVHALAAAGSVAGVEMLGVELWSTRHGRLVAGELGYAIGRTWTSLTGFCSPDEARWSHFGSLQLVLLAERLRDAGFAFWNLGHPHMRYKREIGAEVLRRDAFLHRWRAHRDEAPARPLVDPGAAGALGESDASARA